MPFLVQFALSLFLALPMYLCLRFVIDAWRVDYPYHMRHYPTYALFMGRLFVFLFGMGGVIICGWLYTLIW